jgi:hypothetical protein
MPKTRIHRFGHCDDEEPVCSLVFYETLATLSCSARGTIETIIFAMHLRFSIPKPFKTQGQMKEFRFVLLLSPANESQARVTVCK